MNREELRGKLADYLGDELSPAQRQEFEEALANDPELAQEATALQGTLKDLRRVWTLTPEPIAAQIRPPQMWAAPWLRYAAAACVAFLAGFTARGLTTGVEARNPNQPNFPSNMPASQSDALPGPRIAELALNPTVQRALSSESGFARSLLVAEALAAQQPPLSRPQR